MEIEFKTCLMMPGFTLEGIIKKENSHDIDKETVKLLVHYYNEKNNSKIPRAGESVLIPIIKKADFKSA